MHMRMYVQMLFKNLNILYMLKDDSLSPPHVWHFINIKYRKIKLAKKSLRL